MSVNNMVAYSSMPKVFEITVEIYVVKMET